MGAELIVCVVSTIIPSLSDMIYVRTGTEGVDSQRLQVGERVEYLFRQLLQVIVTQYPVGMLGRRYMPGKG